MANSSGEGVDGPSLVLTLIIMMFLGLIFLKLYAVIVMIGVVVFVVLIVIADPEGGQGYNPPEQEDQRTSYTEGDELIITPDGREIWRNKREIKI